MSALIPIWHVWHQGRAYVVTSPKSIKLANIQVNPGLVLAHPDPMNPVIVEGQARLTRSHQAVLRPLFQGKYDWDIAMVAVANSLRPGSPPWLFPKRCKSRVPKSGRVSPCPPES